MITRRDKRSTADTRYLDALDRPPNLNDFRVLVSLRIRTNVILKRTHTELDSRLLTRLLTRVKNNIMKIYEIQKLPQLSLCRVEEIVP